jgi:hypothetical protein
MNKLLLSSLFVLISFNANANVEVCSNAKDFNGCMSYFAQEQSITNPLVEQMMPFLTKGMFDPNSAELTNLKLYKFDSGHQIITGSINAKNRMGGYTGSLNFVYTVKGLGRNPMRKGFLKGTYKVLTHDNALIRDTRSDDIDMPWATHLIDAILVPWADGGKEWLLGPNTNSEKTVTKIKKHYTDAYGTLNGPIVTVL